MEKRLDNSHYVVFGFVILVLIIGVISVVRAPANDFVGHTLDQIEGVDANNNGVVDRSDRAIVADRATVVDRATIADSATVTRKVNKLSPSLANLIADGVNNQGKPCVNNVDCGSLRCVASTCNLLVNQMS